MENLATPERFVQCTVDCSDEVNARTHQTGIQAYAKLAGANWTFYIKKLGVLLGREPDASSNSTANSQPVDLNLGPSKAVSRKHASIEYNLQTRVWELIVHGRNGVRIDGSYLKENSRQQLSSGNVIEVSGVQMMFVLPETDIYVMPKFMNGSSETMVNAYENENEQHLEQSSPQMANFYDNNPEYTPGKRAKMSPMASEVWADEEKSGVWVRGGHKSNSSDEVNAVFVANEQLAFDSARDIKPPYSYATMIGQAILSSPEKKLTLASIYQWISEHYAYYRHSKSGWQNSIRHNLSLNKAFEKIPRQTYEPGKGMKWQISEEHLDEFMNRSRRMRTVGNAGSLTRQINKLQSSFKPIQMTHMTTPQFHHENAEVDGEYDGRPVYRAIAPNLRGSGRHRTASDGAEENTEQGSLESTRSPAYSASTHSRQGSYSRREKYSSPSRLSLSPQRKRRSMLTKTPEKQRLVAMGNGVQNSPSKNNNITLNAPTSSPAPFWRYMLSPDTQSSVIDSSGTTRRPLSSPPGSGDSICDQKATGERKPSENGTKFNGPSDFMGVDLAKGFERIGRWRENSVPTPPTTKYNEEPEVAH